MLIIKQPFKFLDSFRFRLQDKIMFWRWKSNQVCKAIIYFYAVQMVNYPTLWQRFIICLLPNPNMFKNISTLFRSWIIRFPQFNITMCASNSASLKICSTLTFAGTKSASHGTPTAKSATIKAGMSMAHSTPMCSFCSSTFPKRRMFTLPTLVITLSAQFARTVYQLTALGTRLIISPFIFGFHALIINHSIENVNVQKLMRQKPNYSLDVQGREG